MKLTFAYRIAFLMGLVLAFPVRGQEDSGATTVGALSVLRKYCNECHNGKEPLGRVRVADRRELIDRELVWPGNPDVSELLQLVESGQMPPGKRPKPDDSERSILRAWIKARLPEPPPEVIFGEEVQFDLIAADWKTIAADKQPRIRYLSLNHLLATEAGKKRLPVAKAELQRILQGFTNAKPMDLDLKPLDKAQSIFRLDLASIGWNARPFITGESKKTMPLALDLFDLLLLEYPYGFVPFKAKNWPQMVPIVKTMKALRPVPIIRADWLIATLSDPVMAAEMLLLLERSDGTKAPATVLAEVWPATVDVNEAELELGWSGNPKELQAAWTAVGLPETGGVSRPEWERAWPNLIRQLGRGTPLLPLDRVTRDNYSSDPNLKLQGQTIDFKTKKPQSQFFGGDLSAVEIRSSHDARLEFVFFDHNQQYVSPFEKPQPAQILNAGKTFYEDGKNEKGVAEGHEIDSKPAKEFWVLIAVGRDAGDVKLAPGVPLRVASKLRKLVRERYVHLTLYDLDETGSTFRYPFDRAARVFVMFETLGPRPKGK
ncbi:MAG: hypothetical protein EBV06_11795 [Planctomycetia bacterium]|nr:hypothetical protein [Planctomycetia bacterium]